MDGPAVGKPTVNSLKDLSQLHRQEVLAQRTFRQNALQRALQLTQNLTANLGGPSDLMRSQALQFLLDGPKDIDAECGYPPWLTPEHYRLMYDREGIAKRVVECEPEETWAMDPDLAEDEDPQTETAFESAFNEVNQEFNIWHFLQRIDTISGIGQFGVLLIGIDDGKDLREPVDGVNDDGTFDEGTEHRLLYLRVFDESVVFVKVREIDLTSPRYSMPKIYTVQFRDYPNWGIQAGEIIARDIHWSRVIHVADNRKMSEVYGIPRMQQVFNRLYDLRKIYSSSGEAYWKGAFPGLAFEVNPELADQGIEMDTKSIKEEMERFQNGMQRYLAITGVTTKTIPPMVTDPSGTVETHLKAIAISKGIPYRVLFGSEEAKLAGNQDSRAWNKKLAKRQTCYVNPMIIRPFIDRLIAMGVLPEPEGYEITWPDLNAPTDQDKATVALSETQAMAAYVSGGISALMPPREYLTHILDFTPDEADAILEAASEFSGDEEEPLSQAGQASQQLDQQGAQMQQEMELQGVGDNEVNSQPTANVRRGKKKSKSKMRRKVIDPEGDQSEGGLGGTNPDNGDTLLMPNLSRAGMKHPVDPEMIVLPSINAWTDEARLRSIEVRRRTSIAEEASKHAHLHPHPDAHLAAAMAHERVAEMAGGFTHGMSPKMKAAMASHVALAASHRERAAIPSTAPFAAQPMQATYGTDHLNIANISSEDQARVDQFMGRPTSAKELASLAGASGAPKGAKVNFSIGTNRIEISVRHLNDREYQMDRVFKKDEEGKKFCDNSYFDAGKFSGGTGITCFHSQVESLRAAGFDHISVTAAGHGNGYDGPSGRFCGYNTWAQFGYAAKIAPDLKEKMLRDIPGGGPFDTTFDVMRTQEGRDWWYVNGQGFSGSFNLDSASASSQHLAAYVNQTSTKEKLTKVLSAQKEPGGPAVPPTARPARPRVAYVPPRLRNVGGGIPASAPSPVSSGDVKGAKVHLLNHLNTHRPDSEAHPEGGFVISGERPEVRHLLERGGFVAVGNSPAGQGLYRHSQFPGVQLTRTSFTQSPLSGRIGSHQHLQISQASSR